MARRFTLASAREALVLAGRGLRTWTSRQYLVAVAVAIAFGLAVGIATVLIPNSWFARDIATVWWNYPVWILTSIGAGMLTATYVRPTKETQEIPSEDVGDKRTARMGFAGGVLAGFAVGCPVCNKIALLALGYSGAITWFAPIQPLLAIGAMVLTGLALVWRLRGTVACSVTPARSGAPSRPTNIVRLP